MTSKNKTEKVLSLLEKHQPATVNEIYDAHLGHRGGVSKKALGMIMATLEREDKIKVVGQRVTKISYSRYPDEKPIYALPDYDGDRPGTVDYRDADDRHR